MQEPFDREVAFGRLCELWMHTQNRMQEFEAIPTDFGTGQLLHPSEIHTVQAIGLVPGMNVTGLADRMGVTRGAASQMVARLAGKGLIEKYRLPENDKEVRLRLTGEGSVAFRGHEAQHGWVDRRIYERIGDLDNQTVALLLSVFSAIDEVVKDMVDETRQRAGRSAEGGER